MRRKQRSPSATAEPEPKVDRRHLAVLFAAAVVFIIAWNLTPISESDFWLQLHVGDEIRATHAIPRTIEYAFTEARDAEFVAHEWLPSTFSSLLYQGVGYRGMIAVKCLLALTIAALAFLLALQISRSTALSALIACAVMTAMNFRLQMRPEIFAFIFALVSLNLLVAFRRTEGFWWLAGLLPVTLLWANSHGSFLVGLALPWLFLAGAVIDDFRQRRWSDAATRRQRWMRVHAPLAAAGITLPVVGLINPFGFRLFTHAIAFSQARYLRDNIVEFGATLSERVRTQSYFWCYAVLLALVLLSFIPARRRLDGTAVVLTLAFGALSLDAIRFTGWFALVATYVLAHNLADIGRSYAGQRRLATFGIAALAAGCVIAAVHGDVRGHRIGFRNEAPMSAAALDFVRTASIEGNVFNTFSHGDQLIHAFFPKIRVAIDSRVDAYGEAYFLKYRSLYGRSFRALGPPQDLLDFLDRYHVDTIVTRPLEFQNWTDKGHAEALAQSRWNVVFEDETTVIMRRPPR